MLPGSERPWACGWGARQRVPMREPSRASSLRHWPQPLPGLTALEPACEWGYGCRPRRPVVSCGRLLSGAPSCVPHPPSPCGPPPFLLTAPSEPRLHARWASSPPAPRAGDLCGVCVHACAYMCIVLSLGPVASVQGGDPRAQTQRGCLQSRRARVHQQISKELRMRAGAENLYRCAQPRGHRAGHDPGSARSPGPSLP